jgi:hypothetical protein
VGPRRRLNLGWVRALLGWIALAAASAPARADVCQERDRALVALAERWTTFLDRAKPEAVFYTSRPNRAAHDALLPRLEAAFQEMSPEGRAPSLALECRTWACKLRVLHLPDHDTTTWERSFGTHQQLRGLFRGSQVTARRPSAEMFSGRPLEEMTVYVKLADPTGGPAGSTPRMSPARDHLFQPLGSAGDGPQADGYCGKHLEFIRAKMRLLDETQAIDRPLKERFQQEPPNDKLTREIGPLLQQAAALPGVPLPVRVSCRGTICEVALPDGKQLSGDRWSELYWRRPGLRDRVTTLAPQGSKAYLIVRPVEVADGNEILDRLVVLVEQQAFLDTCHARHPASGHLQVRYILPAADGTKPPRPLRFEMTGFLAETPLARCVNDELVRLIGSIPLPSVRLGAYEDERYDWPRSKPAGQVR